MNAIEIQNLSFSYDEHLILEQKSLFIKKGLFVGIIGPNGGGKTTFLKLLMGFLKPKEGSIQLFEKSPEKSRSWIGYVPQFHKCDREFPITVEELVLLGKLKSASLFGKYPKEILEKASFLMKELGLLDHRKKIFGSLSGGLAQRALLARALLSDPKLLLLDEPTANVDPETTELIMQKIGSVKGKKTVLLVSHDLKTFIGRTDRILKVEKKITEYSPDDICTHFGLFHTPLKEKEEDALILH